MSNQADPKGFVRKDMFFVVVFFALSLGFAAGVITGSMYNPPRPHMQAAQGMGQMPGQMPPQQMPPQQMPPQAGPGGMTEAERARLLALETDVTKRPGDIAALNNLGHFYFDHGMPQKAVETYRKSLEINDNQPDIWTDKGVMHRELKDYEQSLASFEKAIALDPKHEHARFNRGVVLIFDLDRKEEGLAAWRELLAMNPNVRAPNGQLLSDIIASMQ